MSTLDRFNPGFPEERKTGPTYPLFITFEGHIIGKRPNQPSADKNSGCLSKADWDLKIDGVVQSSRRGILLYFLLKDAEEMSRRINFPIADMTASPPESSSRAAVPNYIHYLKSWYFLS